jgi:outer membrane protein assembly factor BamC
VLGLFVVYILVRFTLKFRFFLVSLGLVFSLSSGCGYVTGDEGFFRDRSMDYQKSKLGKSIHLEGAERSQELLPIPTLPVMEKPFQPRDFDDVPRPKLLVSYADDGHLSVRRELGRTQVWVKGDQRVIWQSVKGYLAERKVPLAGIDENHQVIETGWLSKKQLGAKSGFLKKTGRFFSGLFVGRPYWRFHFEVDHALDAAQKNTVAVNVYFQKQRFWWPPASENQKQGLDSLKGMSPEVLAQKGWVAVATKEKFPELFLQGLVGFLAEQDLNQSQFAANQVKNNKRVFIAKDGNGYPQLVIEVGFSEAWDRIGKALDRSKIEVLDKNRSLGSYDISIENTKFSLSKKEPEKYELRLTKGEKKVLVFLQQNDEKLAPVDISTKILDLLRKSLEKQLDPK